MYYYKLLLNTICRCNNIKYYIQIHFPGTYYNYNEIPNKTMPGIAMKFMMIGAQYSSPATISLHSSPATIWLHSLPVNLRNAVTGGL